MGTETAGRLSARMYARIVKTQAGWQIANYVHETIGERIQVEFSLLYFSNLTIV